MACTYKTELTASFIKLGNSPSAISESDFELIMRLTLDVYKKKPSDKTLCDMRLRLFVNTTLDDLR